jgi:hypothetical protein
MGGGRSTIWTGRARRAAHALRAIVKTKRAVMAHTTERKREGFFFMSAPFLVDKKIYA